MAGRGSLVLRAVRRRARAAARHRQDHKRAFDGDEGPNTGGMGAYSPAPVLTDALCKRMMDEIVNPTLRAMKAMGAPYKGVLYTGIMLTAGGPKLVEYNARFGDPECQVLMLRMMSDILPALIASADGQLKNLSLRWYDDDGDHRDHGDEGLSGRLWQGLAHRRSRRGGEGRRRRDIPRRHQTDRWTCHSQWWPRAERLRARQDGERSARSCLCRDRQISWPEGFCRTRHRLARGGAGKGGG